MNWLRNTLIGLALAVVGIPAALLIGATHIGAVVW